jgi:hypothetical protein
VLSCGTGYTLVANLPKNSVSLAVQAEEAGVDALMLNVDGEEGGYSGHFGSYDLHDAYINDVISTVRIPCGLGIGAGKSLSEEYWERIMSSNISFVDMFAHHMPLFVSNDTRLQKFVGIATGYILEQVRQLSLQPGVDALDIAIVPAQARGQPYTIFDHATVKLLAELSAKPVLLRMQKRISQSDLASVLSLGVRGVVADPCVFSGSDETYRDELQSLRPRRGGTEEEHQT